MSKIIVFVEAVEAKGADEAAAKALLHERVERAKVRASERCVQEHQNESGCVAAKFSSLSSTMHSLTFSARKLLEDSIASDCKAQQGICLPSEASEAQCVELAAAAAEAGKEGGKEAGGKEKDKKKK
jgi:hypothetical protein